MAEAAAPLLLDTANILLGTVFRIQGMGTTRPFMSPNCQSLPRATPRAAIQLRAPSFQVPFCQPYLLSAFF
jgi:hypothetical protein